ncbi:Fe3+-hydroxamate ABC transporter,periplasmic protein [Actinobacillus equuli]|nr:Fe3+-hydroxamate ABC transporter,periplasmic protein [Actinobacillus equuli]
MAKAIYPELFKDLDPTKTYQEFYRKTYLSCRKGLSTSIQRVNSHESDND